MYIWSNFWRNPARAKSQHQRPFPVKGVRGVRRVVREWKERVNHETVQHGSSQAQLQVVDTRPRQALCKKRAVSKGGQRQAKQPQIWESSLVSGPRQHDTSKTRRKDDNGQSHMLGQATSQAGNTLPVMSSSLLHRFHSWASLADFLCSVRARSHQGATKSLVES